MKRRSFQNEDTPLSLFSSSHLYLWWFMEHVPVIIFEDDFLLAVHKPAGLNADIDQFNHPSVEAWAVDYLRSKKRPAPFLFHRIDRPTSGVMLLAKKKQALIALQQQQQTGGMRKLYQALVPDADIAAAQLIHHVIKDDLQHRLLVYDTSIPGKTKPARLQYSALRKAGKFTVLEVELFTGRYHQVRAQLAHVGLPVAGDAFYGSAIALGEHCIGLHAWKLLLRHPVTSGPLSITAPLPAYWPAENEKTP